MEFIYKITVLRHRKVHWSVTAFVLYFKDPDVDHIHRLSYTSEVLAHYVPQIR